MEEKTIKIDVGRCAKTLLKKWYVLIGVGLVAAVIMFALKYDTPVYYYATASVYSASSGSYQETSQGIVTMQLYSEIINSQKIADRAASLLGNNKVDGNMLRGMASASYDEDSPILYVQASSTDPTVVVGAANALAKSLVIEAQNITGTQAIQVLDEATTIFERGTGLKRNVAIAFAGGFLLSAAVILLIVILSDRVYRVEDAELDGELEVIGIIPSQNID